MIMVLTFSVCVLCCAPRRFVSMVAPRTFTERVVFGQHCRGLYGNARFGVGRRSDGGVGQQSLTAPGRLGIVHQVKKNSKRWG